VNDALRDVFAFFVVEDSPRHPGIPAFDGVIVTPMLSDEHGTHGAPGGFVADSDERIGPPLRALELRRCARSSFPAPTGERPPFHR
jgi:hypothetical protein